MRVILDTNILLSGLLISQGSPAKLLTAWKRGTFTLISCKLQIDEFRDVAVRPHFKERLTRSIVERLAVDLEDLSDFVSNIPVAHFPPDPKDSYLLGLAEAGAADYLVTGDKALQALRLYRTTQIVSPIVMQVLIEQLAAE